jgi:valyl-tRNA synthetase
MRPQWFLRVLDLKDRLLDRAGELRWHPPFMRVRLEEWIRGLRFDWNISRQRYYGVPFPVWYCEGCAQPVLARAEDLPVDPLESAPPVDTCPACNGTSFAGDTDVMDTWMTSSSSPHILTNRAATPGRIGTDAWPLHVRFQSHDIIRTWLFYTLVKAELHDGSLPWHDVMIASYGLNEQGRPLSKRDMDPRGGGAGSQRYDPDPIIDRFGVDALRHWAAGAQLGHDLRYTERDVKAGRKVVLKLWNIARFCEPHLAGQHAVDDGAPRRPEDRWLLAQVAQAVTDTGAAFDSFDLATARAAVDRLLWTFADDWLELAKARFWDEDAADARDLASGRGVMRTTLATLLGLYAPLLPYVTDALYQRLLRRDGDAVSIHVAPWPVPPVEAVEPVEGVEGMDIVLAVLRAARAYRSERRLPQATELDELVVDLPDPGRPDLEPSLRAAARARRVTFSPRT